METYITAVVLLQSTPVIEELRFNIIYYIASCRLSYKMSVGIADQKEQNMNNLFISELSLVCYRFVFTNKSYYMYQERNISLYYIVSWKDCSFTHHKMFSSASFERDTILEPLCSQLIFQVESIKNDNISSNKCPGFNVVIWLLYLYSFQCHRLDKKSKRMEQTCSEREETVLFFIQY